MWFYGVCEGFLGVGWYLGVCLWVKWLLAGVLGLVLGIAGGLGLGIAVGGGDPVCCWREFNGSCLGVPLYCVGDGDDVVWRGGLGMWFLADWCWIGSRWWRTGSEYLFDIDEGVAPVLAWVVVVVEFANISHVEVWA